jgi:DNA-binding NarL/FixJ family response regulator
MANVMTLEMLAKQPKAPKAVPGSTAQALPTKVLTETDEEIMERLRERFEILDDMTRACKAGSVRAMIVSGPPGVGKSFGVEKILGRYDVLAGIAQDEKLKKYEIIKGAMSPLGLYAKLYAYKESKNIVVFDDCDSVLLDDLSLNILKAALDTSEKRVIQWNTDNYLLRNEGIPNSFEFKGGAIFITNLKFENVNSKKLKDHLAALESRCHYLDLTIDTQHEKLLRIKQIIGDGMLSKYEMSAEVEKEVVDFIFSNQDKMRELSLRMVLKVADLRVSFPHKWEAIARMTCMRS